MVWAKAAVVCGLLVLVAAFTAGTERQLSTTVAGERYTCGPAIGADWLVGGMPEATGGAGSQATSPCDPVVEAAETWTLVALGLGGLIFLVGWTALLASREPSRDAEPRPRVVPA